MEAGSSGGTNPKDNERSNSKNNCKFTKTAVLSVFCPGVPQSSRRFGKSVQYSDATGR